MFNNNKKSIMELKIEKDEKFGTVRTTKDKHLKRTMPSGDSKLRIESETQGFAFNPFHFSNRMLVNYPRTKDSWASDFNGMFALRTDQLFSWFRLRLINPSLRIIDRSSRCRLTTLQIYDDDFVFARYFCTFCAIHPRN